LRKPREPHPRAKRVREFELLAALERLEKQVWEKFKNKDKAGIPPS